MRRLSDGERSVESYLRMWRASKRLQLPAWWIQVAPRESASFWREVEVLRKKAGVRRDDVTGMTMIINELKSQHYKHR